MSDTNKIQTGSAVRLLKDTDDLQAGTVGLVNSVVHIDMTYVWFMPSTEFKVFVLPAEFFELIPEDEAEAMGFEELTPEAPEGMEFNYDKVA